MFKMFPQSIYGEIPENCIQFCWKGRKNVVTITYIYNGIIFPSLNPAKIFQFISQWTESTKSSAVGPNHMRSD